MAAIPRLRGPAALQTLGALVFNKPLSAYLDRRYPDAGLLKMRVLGVGDVVLATSPETVRAIYTADDDTVRAGEANALVISPVGRDSIMLADGERHLRLRRLLLPPFHGEAVRRYDEIVARVTNTEVDRWRVGERFALQPRMQGITLDVILEAVVGVREHPELRRLLGRYLAAGPIAFLLEGRYPWLAQGALARVRPWLRTRARVSTLLREQIARDPTGRDDVLAQMIAAGLSEDELHDQLVTLLLAGHETTASTLAWCFELLLHHPHALARAREDDAYLEAVISETMRLQPVVEVTWRRLVKPLQVGGHELPAGTIVTPSIAAAQNAVEDYDAFRPERFLDAKPPAYAHIPFGGGRRRCLGAAFATMEMRRVLRTVLARAELRAVGRPERPSRMRRFTTVPARGARVEVLQLRQLNA